jgi:WD40 repeat protein
VTGDAGGKIYVWDVSGAESLIELGGHAEAITSLAFADDGRTLLSADAGGAVLAWRSEFDADRYKRWRRFERTPLRAQRIVDFFGGDLREAAERLDLGVLGLDSSDPAVKFILEEARRATSSNEAASSVDER